MEWLQGEEEKMRVRGKEGKAKALFREKSAAEWK